MDDRDTHLPKAVRIALCISGRAVIAFSLPFRLTAGGVTIMASMIAKTGSGCRKHKQRRWRPGTGRWREY
jgi:hypothetical protein